MESSRSLIRYSLSNLYYLFFFFFFWESMTWTKGFQLFKNIELVNVKLFTALFIIIIIIIINMRVYLAKGHQIFTIIYDPH